MADPPHPPPPPPPPHGSNQVPFSGASRSGGNRALFDHLRRLNAAAQRQPSTESSKSPNYHIPGMMCKALSHMNAQLRSLGPGQIAPYYSRISNDPGIMKEELKKVIKDANLRGPRQELYTHAYFRSLLLRTYNRAHRMTVLGDTEFLEMHKHLSGAIGNRWIARVLSCGSAAFNDDYLRSIGFREPTQRHRENAGPQSIDSLPGSHQSSTQFDRVSTSIATAKDSSGQSRVGGDACDNHYSDSTASNTHGSASAGQGAHLAGGQHNTGALANKPATSYRPITNANKTPDNTLASQGLRLAAVQNNNDGTFTNNLAVPYTSVIVSSNSREPTIIDLTHLEDTDEDQPKSLAQSISYCELINQDTTPPDHVVQMDEIIAATMALCDRVTAVSDILEANADNDGGFTICNIPSHTNPTLTRLLQGATGILPPVPFLREHVRKRTLGLRDISTSLFARFLYNRILTCPVAVSSIEIAEEMYSALKSYIEFNIPFNRDSQLTDTLMRGFESICASAIKLKALFVAMQGPYCWEWPDLSNGVVSNKLAALSSGPVRRHESSSNSFIGRPKLILVMFPALVLQDMDDDWNEQEVVLFKALVAAS